MRSFWNWFDEQDLQLYFTATLTAAFVALALWFAKRLVWRRLGAWRERSPIRWAGELIERTRAPVNWLIGVASVATGAQLLPVTVQRVPVVSHGLKIGAIWGVFWLLDRAAIVFLRFGKIPGQMNEATQGLAIGLVRAFFFLLASLIALDTLGISITPLLASLGVGSIALALALQDTLGNLFSGFYMLIDRPVRAGDYVRLEPGLEGVVRKIGWRSTRIESDNNTIVIPNSKLSSSTLTNFDVPRSDTSVVVSLGVAYDVDLERVERVIQEVGREVTSRVDGGVPEAEPLVRFTALGDSAIQLNVVVRARRFTDTALVRSELIKALHARLVRERIEIPFPQRVVHMALAAQPAPPPARS